MIVATLALELRGRSMADVSNILDNALGPICAIILITGREDDAQDVDGDGDDAGAERLRAQPRVVGHRLRWWR